MSFDNTFRRASCDTHTNRQTDLQERGDLRPYLLLQVLPLVLIPLLQWQARRPLSERMAFCIAIGLYVLAKLCEIGDQHVLEWGGLVSGHTLKHLLATLVAGMVAWQVWRGGWQAIRPGFS